MFFWKREKILERLNEGLVSFAGRRQHKAETSRGFGPKFRSETKLKLDLLGDHAGVTSHGSVRVANDHRGRCKPKFLSRVGPAQLGVRLT